MHLPYIYAGQYAIIQGSHYLENQGKSGNYELSGMSGNCQGIFLSVRELMGKQVHFYASGLQPCPAH
jgi:hypothetical protein